MTLLASENTGAEEENRELKKSYNFWITCIARIKNAVYSPCSWRPTNPQFRLCSKCIIGLFYICPVIVLSVFFTTQLHFCVQNSSFESTSTCVFKKNSNEIKKIL